MSHPTIVLRYRERDTESQLTYYRAECQDIDCTWHSKLFHSKGLATVSKNLHQRQDELRGQVKAALGSKEDAQATKEPANGQGD
jgi:hypothetical protein